MVMVGEVLEIVRLLKTIALMSWFSKLSSSETDGLPQPWLVLRSCTSTCVLKAQNKAEQKTLREKIPKEILNPVSTVFENQIILELQFCNIFLYSSFHSWG